MLQCYTCQQGPGWHKLVWPKIRHFTPFGAPRGAPGWGLCLLIIVYFFIIFQAKNNSSPLMPHSLLRASLFLTRTNCVCLWVSHVLYLDNSSVTGLHSSYVYTRINVRLWIILARKILLPWKSGQECMKKWMKELRPWLFSLTPDTWVNLNGQWYQFCIFGSDRSFENCIFCLSLFVCPAKKTSSSSVLIRSFISIQVIFKSLPVCPRHTDPMLIHTGLEFHLTSASFRWCSRLPCPCWWWPLR